MMNWSYLFFYRLIDTNYVHLVDLFKKYNVLEVVVSTSTLPGLC